MPCQPPVTTTHGSRMSRIRMNEGCSLASPLLQESTGTYVRIEPFNCISNFKRLEKITYNLSTILLTVRSNTYFGQTEKSSLPRLSKNGITYLPLRIAFILKMSLVISLIDSGSFLLLGALFPPDRQFSPEQLGHVPPITCRQAGGSRRACCDSQ